MTIGTVGILLMVVLLQIWTIQLLQGEVKALGQAVSNLQTGWHSQDEHRLQDMATLSAHIEHLAQEVQDAAVRQALKATHDAFSLPPITPFQP